MSDARILTCILGWEDGWISCAPGDWIACDPCPYCNPDEYERWANAR